MIRLKSFIILCFFLDSQLLSDTMPEFRIRRKKRDKRRHTLHDSTEAARQIQQASQLYQEHNEIIFGPNEVVSGHQLSMCVNI